ncbi:MAG: hypothetical protein RR544_06240 [Oscillospiraceae bacterium]
MKRVLWGGLALCFLLLTGCGGREPENTILVRILAVDRVETGLRLTAYSGVQDLGETPGVCLTGEGDSLEEALKTLRTKGNGYPSLTHMTQLVVGEGVALEPLLESLVTGRETGYSATLWQVTGTAAEVLAGAKTPVERLEALEKNGGAQPPNILDGLVSLRREGQVSLPVLLPAGEDLARGGDRRGG